MAPLVEIERFLPVLFGFKRDLLYSTFSVSIIYKVHVKRSQGILKIGDIHSFHRV